MPSALPLATSSEPEMPAVSTLLQAVPLYWYRPSSEPASILRVAHPVEGVELHIILNPLHPVPVTPVLPDGAVREDDQRFVVESGYAIIGARRVFLIIGEAGVLHLAPGRPVVAVEEMAASNLRALGGGDIARRGDLIDLLPHLADSGQQAALSIRPHGEDASRVSFRGGQAVADAHPIPVPAVRPGVDAVLTVEVQFGLSGLPDRSSRTPRGCRAPPLWWSLRCRRVRWGLVT